METPIAQKMRLRTFLCLNRTMQYGNKYASVMLANAVESLNRTMQYGNAYLFMRQNEGKMFKSYYVVWKLFRYYEGDGGTDVFKSYYVVWKLDFPSRFVPFFLCLNRTMQYGNHFLCLWGFRTPFRLNRTMQYGNFLPIFSKNLRTV